MYKKHECNMKDLGDPMKRLNDDISKGFRGNKM